MESWQKSQGSHEKVERSRGKSSRQRRVRVSGTESRARLWASIMAFPITSCLILVKLLNFSVSQFSHLYNGDNKRTTCIECLNKVLFVFVTHTHAHTQTESGCTWRQLVKGRFKCVTLILNLDVWCRNSLSRGKSRWKSYLETTRATGVTSGNLDR